MMIDDDMMINDDAAEVYIAEIPAAKRIAVRWAFWMGDWFVSHSPRNGNSNAEGPWDHWVYLAVAILQHPATAITRPDAHAAAQGLEVRDYYDEVDRGLTDAELARLFRGVKRASDD